MNRRKAVRLMIAVAGMLAVLIAESFIAPDIATAQPRCSIRGIFGRKCEITCESGQYARCRSGIFGVRCTCDRKRGGFDWPLPDPPVTAAEFDCARRFRDYLMSLGTSEATALANAINIAMAAVEAGDEAMYNEAENQYDAVMENSSTMLRQQIEEWIAANPDCALYD